MPQRYSLPLGLDLAPNTKDTENLQDFYRLYNACKLLAEGLDAYTGIVGIAQEDWPVTGPAAIMVQNMCRHYAYFAAAATPGQLIGLDASGQAILGTPGTVVGWSPATVAAGQWGEVRLFGLHTNITGLTPGLTYFASATPGGITPTTTSQRIGKALTANRLFFNPQ